MEISGGGEEQPSMASTVEFAPTSNLFVKTFCGRTRCARIPANSSAAQLLDHLGYTQEEIADGNLYVFFAPRNVMSGSLCDHLIGEGDTVRVFHLKPQTDLVDAKQAQELVRQGDVEGLLKMGDECSVDLRRLLPTLGRRTTHAASGKANSWEGRWA